MKLLIVGLVLLMATASAQVGDGVAQLAQQPRVRRALEWLERNTDWVTEQHIRLTEIPAPTFEERERATHLRKVFEEMGLRVEVDAVGNLIGERRGTHPDEIILVTAHLDTVFDGAREVRVRREAGRLYAPGISDNGAGLAALVGVARAFDAAKLRTRATVVFAANVGEEGEGNLLGMRQLVQTYRDRLQAVVVLDGAATDHVTTMALASRRFEVIVSGPGGHSWSDYGMPNPIQALARGVARLARVRVPDKPRTSLNVGEISGGTSVNSIPARAAIKVDIRSESNAELDRLEAALREAIQGGVEEETAAAQNRTTRLVIEIRSLGVRPGGELRPDAPLLAAIRQVDSFLGIETRLERSSTDANVPLSLGLPAITIGGGGQGGGAHSLNEWYDPTGRDLGLKRILLTILSVAGAEP